MVTEIDTSAFLWSWYKECRKRINAGHVASNGALVNTAFFAAWRNYTRYGTTCNRIMEKRRYRKPIPFLLAYTKVLPQTDIKTDLLFAAPLGVEYERRSYLDCARWLEAQLSL